MRAFAYRSGVIGFGRKLPPLDVALPIADAPRAILMQAIKGCARLAYDNKTWLVPGIPEADGDFEACDALLVFNKRIHRRIDRLLGDGGTLNRGKAA